MYILSECSADLSVSGKKKKKKNGLSKRQPHNNYNIIRYTYTYYISSFLISVIVF